MVFSANSLVANRLQTQIKRFFIAAMALLLSLVQAPVFAEEKHPTRGEFYGATDTIYPDWFKVSFMELEEDVAEAAEEGRRLMLVFHQNGCPYCNAFVERNLAQKDIEEWIQAKFDVIEINIFGDREVVSVGGETYTEKKFAEALNVQFTPTVLFLDEKGGLALRLNGYYDPDKFRVALKVNELSDRPGKGSKPLLVLFEQGTCRNCETLHDTILSKPQSQELLAQFDVYQVDMWGRDSFETPDGTETSGRQWSKELNVSYAPTMILYAADGTEVIRSEAFFKTFHTQSIMDYVLSGGWEEEANFQRFLSARADALRDQGKNVDIWDSNQ